jgi:hypothetical protein
MTSVLVVEFKEQLERPDWMIQNLAPDATVREIRSEGCVYTFILESPGTHQVSGAVGQLGLRDDVVCGHIDMGGHREDVVLTP